MKEMSLVDHLEDLKKTAIRIVFIIIGSFIVSYAFGDVISEFLLRPLRDTLDVQGGKIIYIDILDKVISQFMVAFWSAILISAPLWFHQLWLFIKPGLYPREIKVIRPFILVGFLLFCLGVAFGYFIVFPLTFETLMSFGVGNVEASIALRRYLELVCKVLVFLGVVFQLPNVLLILGFMGLVTKYSLRSIRRYVYVAFAGVSAFLTPPDVVTMLGLWVPLIALYEIGVIAVAWIVHPYLARVHKS